MLPDAAGDSGGAFNCQRVQGLSVPGGRTDRTHVSSEEPLDEDEATGSATCTVRLPFPRMLRHVTACRSRLTAVDGGVEPTYPYCRLLLRFDAAALLLALGFRGFILHRGSERRHKPALHRQDTARALASSSLSSLSPHSIQMAPSIMHNILAGMNRSTREDCQLAAEYLLLRYSPHETKQQLRLFQGFHHILRTWHRHEGRWAPLLLAHIHGPNIHPTELFAHTNEVFTIAARLHSGAVPDGLQTTAAASLPGLLYVSVINTARFLDHHAPRLHERTNESMGSTADHGRLAYLCCLLGPPSADDEEESGSGPSAGVPPRLRQTTF